MKQDCKREDEEDASIVVTSSQQQIQQAEKTGKHVERCLLDVSLFRHEFAAIATRA